MTITIRELDETTLASAELLTPIVEAFARVKPDSVVCRMPKRLIPPYFRAVQAEGGRILIATESGSEAVGFLVFVRDNNVSLRYLRKHKWAVSVHWLCSMNLMEKSLLAQAVISSMKMGSAELPPDFLDEISLLAVSDKAQGKGVGRSLIAYLRKVKPGSINVKTEKNNVGAIRFYNANGFVAVNKITVGTRTLICFASEEAHLPATSP